MDKGIFTGIINQRGKTVLTVSNHKFVIGKEEYHLSAAEIHYFRTNKKYWSVCFERIRKAGFKIISTCVPWSLHEVAPGTFDFLGQTDSSKDLVVFLELSREFGLKVILRVGPYIDSEWENGGYPNYLFTNPEILAKTPQGENVAIPSPSGINLGYVPCYHHPKFKIQIKRYLNSLTEVLRNYIYPKGPVFLIQLENLLSWKDYDLFKLDYNPHITSNLYPEFLKNKYADIKHLSKTYQEKYKQFEDVKPPPNFKYKTLEDLIRYWDWISFKENYLAQYLKELKDSFTSAEIQCLFYTNLGLKNGPGYGLDKQILDKEQIFTSGEAFWNSDYYALARNLRFWSANLKFPWLANSFCGFYSASPHEREKYFPSTPQMTKFMLSLSLACGIKGFDHYMFVERQYWHDAALAQDGSIKPNYEVLHKFNTILERIPVHSLQSLAEVGLAYYKPYSDYLALKSDKPFPYISQLLEKSWAGLSQDLSYLKLDYRVPDLNSKESLAESKLLLVPSAQFMEQTAQENILAFARSGKTVILFGLMPEWDLNFKKSNLLYKALKIKTKLDGRIDEIETDTDEKFSAYVFADIKRSGRKAKEIAWQKRKCVGVFSSYGKGKILFFTFDLASDLNPAKLLFLEKLFQEYKINPVAHTSDPQVEVVAQKVNKSTLIYLFNPQGSFWQSKDTPQPVILSLNCKKLGIKGGKVLLQELFTDEVIKTKVKELSQGIAVHLKEMDSKLYLIEKK